MIIRFNKFNENKIDELKTSVTSAFVYISDDNIVEIDSKESEVIVNIKTTLPSSIVYDNIDEYVDKHSKWSETLLDISVIIKQLEINKDIKSISSINTVGNVKIRFFINNNKILVSDNNRITISTLNFSRVIFDIIQESPKLIRQANGSPNGSTNEISLYFNNNIDIDRLSTGITMTLIELLKINKEDIRIDFYNYTRSSISITIKKHRDNNTNRLKNIKLQYTI